MADTTPPAHKAKVQKTQITDALRSQAQVIHTIDDAGAPITRAQALADLMWKEALGWVEVKKDDRGNKVEVIHPPILSVQTVVVERLDGKVANVAEVGGTIKAADRVRDLAKSRVNKLAEKHAEPVSKPA